MRIDRLMLGLAVLLAPLSIQAAGCESGRVSLQMLGTRGPELWDARASTGYLLWLDGKARVVVDAGPGSVQNFEASGARYEDLSLFLFSHFHIDHSADFPAYVKGGFFTGRKDDLLIIGPDGNDYLPSADEFLTRLFAPRTGLYPYMSSFIDGSGAYRIRAKTVPSSYKLLDERRVYDHNGIRVTAVSVHHAVLPALAYRVEMAGCVISFTGDMSGRFHTMPDLAKGSDILVAHNAIPEDQTGAGQLLHMRPGYIGKLAAEAGVRKLILTHLMKRSAGRRDETLKLIRQHYQGPVVFADDLQRFQP
ncbi:MBL fold metallo-hydrolase [Thiolapillus brandeum]|uniref:Beta-lactamase domain protein n=1 Tax=Thiolapillus brandeum TaxID=1076588 RepID=A0A7U6JIF2_9GAMM|nr:MBL fold metallo-hydrolase [Thiolapillus brandeum]BAO44170.1 beta-lactamase domain protein [Thiolapillus brandeum]